MCGLWSLRQGLSSQDYRTPKEGKEQQKSVCELHEHRKGSGSQEKLYFCLHWLRQMCKGLSF